MYDVSKIDSIFVINLKKYMQQNNLQQNQLAEKINTSSATDGDIAIVLVNGNDATCKKIKRSKDGIQLIPFNNVYDVLYYTNKEIEELPVRIIGKVIELRREF